MLRALLDDIAAELAASPKLDAEIRDDARRESRLIVSAMLGCTPGELAMRLDAPIPHTQSDRIRRAAARRGGGAPLAYAVGVAPFRHLVLDVDERVLIPRPETEIVVDHALRLAASRPGGIAVDIGTGSGAIALSLALEGGFDRVLATDVSRDALEVARGNSAHLGPHAAPVEFRQGADLSPLEGMRARVIVSNPPYIAYEEADALPPSVRDWEPAMALFAPDGGMARYAVLLAGAREHLEPGGWIVLEVDSRRGEVTAALAHGAGLADVRLYPDLTGRDRVLVARSPD